MSQLKLDLFLRERQENFMEFDSSKLRPLFNELQSLCEQMG